MFDLWIDFERVLSPACFMRSALCLFAFCFISFSVLGADLRIGIIGCDTSHVPEFTEILNNPQA